ncbi:MAG TPA: DinB family protein [Candidatus Eisenbacteria bacterium]
MSPAARRIDPMITELEHESAATKRLLESVPADKLEWRPHPKSMTLGQLANHLAGIPGNISRFLEVDEFDAATVSFTPPQPTARDEILRNFEESLATARSRMNELDDTRAGGPFRFHRGGVEIFTIPKEAVMRNMLLNHTYHHRGQLTVYLRLLEIPVPATYGRSADVNPFG